MENPKEIVPEESIKPSTANVPNTPKHLVKKEQPVTFKIPANVRALNKQRLREFIEDLDPNQRVDDDVEEMLLEISDVFLENVLTYSCDVAQNRNAEVLEVKDVKLILENYWNMNIPGFDSDELVSLESLNRTSKNKKRKISKETVCEE